MKYYAVIDTNVIVSSFFKDDSTPNQIVKLALTGTIIPLINEEILDEYNEVLLRSKFQFDKIKVADFLDELIENAKFLDKTKADEDFIDQDDIVFYEIVLTAKKTDSAYLITGNKKHFPIKPFVVTPKEMLDIINCKKN